MGTVSFPLKISDGSISNVFACLADDLCTIQLVRLSLGMASSALITHCSS